MTSVTIHVDSFINVLRRRPEILYRYRTDQDSCNLGYFSSQKISSARNVTIFDRSKSLVANRVESGDQSITLENTNTYTIGTDKFLLTDVFADDNTTQESLPLYYQHILNTDHVARVSGDDLTLAATTKLLAVEVLNESLRPLDNGSVKIDWDKGIIYNNVSNLFDQVTEDFTVYYVRYSVKTDNVVKTYLALLDNQTVYTIATLDDLNDDMNIIQDGRKVYLVQEEEGHFKITLPTSGKYAFSLSVDSRIELEPPALSDVDDQWHVAVSNGKFFTKISDIVYKYSIAEYIVQSWNPSTFIGTKKSINEDSTIMAEHLVKLRYPRVKEDAGFTFYLNMLVDDSDGTPLTAFTTDPNKEGDTAPNGAIYVKWNVTAQVGIRSVDHRNGIVDIDGYKIKSDYVITTTYFYDELSYRFALIDFNPLNTPEILQRRVSFFLDPDTIFSSKSQTLYYLISDKSGRVLLSNWTAFDNESQKVNDGPYLYLDAIPDWADELGNSGVIFSDLYSTEGSGVFLLLGDVEVAEDFDPSQGLLLDTRVRGGGVIESDLEDLQVLNPEVNWHWDVGFWDGTPYPGTASYLVEVPVEVLEGVGGIFKTNEVRDVIDRHTAAGVYPVARAYGLDPFITAVDVTQSGVGTITVSWRGA